MPERWLRRAMPALVIAWFAAGCDVGAASSAQEAIELTGVEAMAPLGALAAEDEGLLAVATEREIDVAFLTGGCGPDAVPDTPRSIVVTYDATTITIAVTSRTPDCDGVREDVGYLRGLRLRLIEEIDGREIRVIDR